MNLRASKRQQKPGNSEGVWRLALGLVLLAALFGRATLAADEDPTFDLLLTGGQIVDGTGAPARKADVAVRDGRIVAIGDLSSDVATTRIDIAGQVLAPGFIDVHSHADRAFVDSEAAAMEGLLRQGVTTAVFGGDGFKSLDELRHNRDLAAAGNVGVNFMSYIGHNSIRLQIVGPGNRVASEDDIFRMKEQVRDAMEFGAVGLSSGLMYLPGRYAPHEELVELARELVPFDGRYDSHVRDPVNQLLASHQECLDVGKAAGVHAHPAHMKAVASNSFGKGKELVDLVEKRLSEGQDISVDLYPYDGASAAPNIHLLFPGDDAKGMTLFQRMQHAQSEGKSLNDDERTALYAALQRYWQESEGQASILKSARAATEQPAEGVFSWINTVGYGSLRIVVSADSNYEGRIVSELAAQLGISGFELLRRIVVDEGASAMVTLGAIQEADVQLILTRPWAMVASDGEELNPTHPRGRGTFPRLLGRYARDWGVLELEDAVHKITGLPARYLKLRDRGVIATGAVADLTVFDPDTIIDRATWSEPALYAVGVSHVFIKGEAALLAGELLPNRLGRFLPFAVEEPKVSSEQ
jgi:N-acyl-D-aspartate/D-glutamate deacylase